MAEVSGSKRAVVLGAGLAGVLSASVLARHVDSVVVVERHALPSGPGPRQGVPQARHAHLLWSSGARTVDALLPGTMDAWLAAGAHRVGVPDRTVILSTEGWLRRWPEMQFMVTATRDLIDWVVRERALGNAKISVRENHEAIGLLGDAAEVNGVRVVDHTTGQTADVPADLVIDASGRGSVAPRWLGELGLGQVRERTVDSGLTYATRIFAAPKGANEFFPVVNVQADPHSGQPGQTSVLLPVEDDRWLVTLSSTRGAEPPTDDEGFVRFARSVRHPIVGDIVAHGEPLTPIYRSHSTVNRRRYFEKLRRWPSGFIVLGDAVATYNPIYGHGMSVVAHSVATLRRTLERGGVGRQTAVAVQRGIAEAVNPAWATATIQDVLYPGTTGSRPNPVTRAVQRYLERVTRAALGRPVAAQALFDAFTLSVPMTRVVHPAVVLAALRGPSTAAADQPPFTADELDIISLAAHPDGTASPSP